MARKTTNLEDCIAIAAVTDDAIIARDGALTIGWELFCGEEYGITQEQYDIMTKLMTSSFRTLEEWTMVHRQDVYCRRRYHSEESGHFLCDCFSRHFEGREYMEHRQFIWFTFNPAKPGKPGVMKPAFGASAGGIRYKSPVMKNLQHTIDKFSSRCSEFMAALSASGCIRYKRVTSEELEGTPGGDAGLLEEYRCWFGEPYSSSDIVQTDGTYLDMGKKRMFSYSMSQSDDFPSEISNTIKEHTLSTDECDIVLSGTSPLGSALPFEHIVNIYYLLPDQQFAIRELDRRKKNMTAMSSGSTENEVNAEGISQFIEMIHSESSMAIFSHMNIMAWGEREKTDSMQSAISAALKQMGMSAKQNTVDMPQLFLAGFPGGALEIGEDNMMLCELEQAMCTGIFETYTRDFPNGTLKICDRRRHIPVVIDTQQAAYEANLIENYNAFILGPSGTGKSFFTNWYVRNCFDAGQHVFIIDKGDSYEGLCKVINHETGGRDGVYYKWSNENPFAFAPFEGCREWNNDSDDVNFGMSFLISVIKIIWTPSEGWNNVNESVLYRIIEGFIGSLPPDSPDPIFDDFLKYIKAEVTPRILGASRGSKSDAVQRKHTPYVIAGVSVTPDIFDIRSMSIALDHYSKSGRFGFLLNNPHPSDLFRSRFVVFEVDAISNIDKTLYALCTFCIIHVFERKMRSRSDAFRLMFIEEAWQAIASDATAEYLRGVWKTARKYHTSATVVTQQVSDIISSPIIKDAIIGNSPVKILLDQKDNKNAMKEIALLLGLNPTEKALMASVGKKVSTDAPYREVFISLGGKRCGVYALEVSPEEAMVYESDKVAKRPLMDAAKQEGDIIKAIEKLRKKARK